MPLVMPARAWGMTSPYSANKPRSPLEGPDHLGGKHFDFVPELNQLACPVLFATASLHADQALSPVGKVLQKLLALELHAHDLTRLAMSTPTTCLLPFIWSLQFACEDHIFHL